MDVLVPVLPSMVKIGLEGGQTNCAMGADPEISQSRGLPEAHPIFFGIFSYTWTASNLS
jgi:hypothetical protein